MTLAKRRSKLAKLTAMNKYLDMRLVCSMMGYSWPRNFGKAW